MQVSNLTYFLDCKTAQTSLGDLSDLSDLTNMV